MSSSDPCVKAVTLAQKGDINQAINKLDRCKKKLKQQIKKLGDRDEIAGELKKQLAKAFRLEAQLYISKNTVSRAISQYEQALSILDEVNDDNEIIYLKAHTLYSLALIDFIQNNLTEAYEKYERSNILFFSISYYLEASEILFRMVNILSQQNQINRSWEISEQLKSTIKKIKKKDTKKSLFPRLYLVQSQILFDQNKQKEGLKLLKKAKNEFENLKNTEGVISVLMTQSRIEPDITIEKKEDLLLEALELANIIESTKHKGEIETELGLILLKSGNFEKGKKRLLRGLELKTEIGDQSGTAQSLIELSRISLITSQNESDLNKSKNFASQALELFKEVNNDYGKAQTYELIGTINTKLGQIEEALSQLR
ncbi:MAG: hypothetical protein ACXAC2_19990, partial [Candidatus Kariarchaeaceae archaeon]